MIIVYKILFSTCIPATVPEENRWHTQIKSSRDSSIKGQFIKTWAGRVRVQQPRAQLVTRWLLPTQGLQRRGLRTITQPAGEKCSVQSSG